MTTLPPLRFDNRFLEELPGDPEVSPRRRQVMEACWSRVHPTPVASPRLLAHSREMAEALGFSPAMVHSDAFARVFSGNQLLPGMDPFAACYGGHQFGVWAGQLGDGRAISLGEVVTPGGIGGSSSSRGRTHPLLPHRRRPGRPPVIHPGVPLQRGHAPPGGPHHPGPVPGGHRGGGGPGHVLRREPPGRARRRGVPGGSLLPPLRELRDPGGPAGDGAPGAAGGLHHLPGLPPPGGGGGPGSGPMGQPGSGRWRSAPPGWWWTGCGWGSSTGS
jgi:hypothetical protein